MFFISKVKQVYFSRQLKIRLSKWKKDENIMIEDSLKIFPETSISAGLGKIRIGAKTCIRGNLEVQRKDGRIQIGNNCYVGANTRIWAADSIIIGNNVLIAHNVNIFDNDTHPLDIYERREDAENIIWKGIRKNFSSLEYSEIVIEDDVWIGCNSVILKGVHIGKGAIISAGSVVSKDVPEYAMISGNPAVIIQILDQNKSS